MENKDTYGRSQTSERFKTIDQNGEMPRVRSNQSYNEKQMRSRSTSGKYSSNTRQKAKVSKKWHRTAIAVTIATSMFVGGYLSKPLDDAIDYVTNWARLKEMTSSFEDNVINKNIYKTYTQDTSLNYQNVAKAIEADGKFTNQELLMAVDTIGEVQTNAVLQASTNPPAENVEAYMRNNNISDLKDWKDKTIKAMAASERVNEAQDELDAIFRDEAINNQSSQDYTDDTTYGGK